MVCGKKHKVRQDKPPQGAKESSKVAYSGSVSTELLTMLEDIKEEQESVHIFSYDANGSYIDQD